MLCHARVHDKAELRNTIVLKFPAGEVTACIFNLRQIHAHACRLLVWTAQCVKSRVHSSGPLSLCIVCFMATVCIGDDVTTLKVQLVNLPSPHDWMGILFGINPSSEKTSGCIFSDWKIRPVAHNKIVHQNC